MALTLTAAGVSAGWTVTRFLTSALTGLDAGLGLFNAVPRSDGGYMILQLVGGGGNKYFFLLDSELDGQTLTLANAVSTGTIDLFSAVRIGDTYYSKGRNTADATNHLYSFTEGGIFTSLGAVLSPTNPIAARGRRIYHTDAGKVYYYDVDTGVSTLLATPPISDLGSVSYDPESNLIHVAQTNNARLYGYDADTGVLSYSQMSGIWPYATGYIHTKAVLNGTLAGNLIVPWQKEPAPGFEVYVVNYATGDITHIANASGSPRMSAWGEDFLFSGGSDYIDRLTCPAGTTAHQERFVADEEEPEPGYTVIQLPADDSTVVELPADDSLQACLPAASGYTQACLPDA